MVLVFIVLASTMSFTIERHFCGGELIGVTMFSEGLDCCSAKCEPKDGVIESHCCKAVVDVIKGLDTVVAKAASDSFIQQQLFLISNINPFLTFFNDLELIKSSYRNYTPPERVIDICILDQVFLI